MPARPPLFRPPGYKPREPWAARGPRGKATTRIRGRAGQKLRAEVLAEEPFCRRCLAKGLQARAEVVDHITPLAWGGAEARANRQALCHPCHDEKSAAERANGGARGAAFPDWLQPAARELTIVCGPPFSGRAELVRAQAGPGDRVICFDTIRRQLWPGFRPWSSPHDPMLNSRALAYRNHLLGALARPGGPAAWLIVLAPCQGERDWWQDRLGGEMVLLETSEAECKARARAAGKPGALRWIEDWFRRSQLSWERE